MVKIDDIMEFLLILENMREVWRKGVFRVIIEKVLHQLFPTHQSLREVFKK